MQDNLNFIMYQLGGFMTATSTYDAHAVREWGNGVSITTSKSASYFDVTLANGLWYLCFSCSLHY